MPPELSTMQGVSMEPALLPSSPPSKWKKLLRKISFGRSKRGPRKSGADSNESSSSSFQASGAEAEADEDLSQTPGFVTPLQSITALTMTGRMHSAVDASAPSESQAGNGACGASSDQVIVTTARTSNPGGDYFGANPAGKRNYTLTVDEHDTFESGAEAAPRLCVALKGHVRNAARVAAAYGVAIDQGCISHLLLQLFGGRFQHVCTQSAGEEPARFLSMLEGSWSFVVLDSETGFVLAARSRDGGTPLYWGIEGDKSAVLFSCDPLIGMHVSAAFPPGMFCQVEMVGGKPKRRSELFTAPDMPLEERRVRMVPEMDPVTGKIKRVVFKSPSGQDLCAGGVCQ